ncbi:HesA/MoeB/ThiF family protein [Solihabitans fulvus]|nr:ThiF family adenylyltransferase [Solihabitans fulvus]
MLRPKIKQAHNPMRLSPTLIYLGGARRDGGAELTDDDEGTLWRLIQLMDGSRTEDAVVAELTWERPHLDPDRVREAIGALIESGFVEDAGAPAPANLSEAELDRYAGAADYFSWVDITPRASRYDLQSRLKSKHVTVCGMGGAGSAAAAALVAAGVGALHCVDFDRIEPSSLTRQLLFTEDDIGASKVEAVVARLSRMNSNVRVTGEELELTSSADLERLMRDTDVLVLCADQPHGVINTWASAASLATGTPWQAGLYAGPTLMSGLFVPGVDGCFDCLPTQARHFERRQGSPQIETAYPGQGHAVLAPTANLTGHVAALQVVNHLVGLTPTAVGRMFHLSLTDLSFSYFVEPRLDADCAVCGRRAVNQAAAGHA